MSIQIFLISGLIYIVGSILIMIVYNYLPVFIIGFFPNHRAKDLNASDIEKIKRSGIVHITENRKVKSIVSDSLIKSSSRKKSYSCQFTRASYFFISECLNAKDIVFNFKIRKNKNYSRIHIQNITDKQIQKFKIRTHDNTIMYVGDFSFDIENKIIITKLQTDSKLCSLKNHISLRSIMFFIFIVIIPFLISLTLIILLFIYLFFPLFK